MFQGTLTKEFILLGTLLAFATIKCNSSGKIIEAILLSENFQTCQSVDLNQDRVICEIHSEEDMNSLVCLGLSSCKMPVTHCPDGSNNKTCFPIKDDNSLSYQCICHSKRRAESIVPVTEWTTWTSTNPYQSFKTERSLIVPSLEWTVLQEFSRSTPTMVYIISSYQLPPAVYSASSAINDKHGAGRAAINFITDDVACSWAAEDTNSAWLQMTLPTKYVVMGTLIKQRCDGTYVQYATRVRIATSVEGVTWQTVVESESLSYDSDDGEGSATVMFPQSYTNRYWRIYLISYHSHPSMKADLIGYK